MLNHFTTERLILRSWRKQDLIPLAEINSDQEVMRYFPSPLSFKQTEKLFTLIEQHFIRYGYGLYALELKDNNELIGFTGIYHPGFKAHFIPCTSLGSRIAAKHWGKGYALEAAKKVLELAFKQFAINEVVAFTSENNTQAMRLAEKLGMQHDPHENFIHPDFSDFSDHCRYLLYRINPKFLVP